MLSDPRVHGRLSRGFIGVRLDWEQGNHHKKRFGFILGTGDQLFLDPEGNPIAHDIPGKNRLVHGRHGRDTTPEVLDEVLARHPPRQGPVDLRLEWLLWTARPARRAGGNYPPPAEAIAGFARMPILVIEGAIPEAFRDPRFLERHARQFIWVRGRTEGESRLNVRRVRDGLAAGLSTDLADLDPQSLSREELARALDRAWLEYMMDRPRTARGYLENQHGGWMRGRKEQMLGEEETLRRLAREEKLPPPGRSRDGGDPRPERAF